MEIKTVSIIGLGALGVLFGHQILRHIPKDNLRIIADIDRINRYKKDKIYSNDEVCDFNYMTPEEKETPADLLIFAVKFNGLNEAIKAVENQVGENTIILSFLNGISSEEIIGEVYGIDKLLYSVAQGMDAVKVDNKLTYKNMGMICFGSLDSQNKQSEKIDTTARFFDKVEIPYLVDFNMCKRLWGKFMLNVGVNQAVTVFESDYGGIQKEGIIRNTMIAAMKEVMLLSEKENIFITQSDLDYWLSILNVLNPHGKPSMRQDIEAKRYSEVELFAGTVIKLAEKHGVAVPINQMIYDKIKEMERHF